MIGDLFTVARRCVGLAPYREGWPAAARDLWLVGACAYARQVLPRVLEEIAGIVGASLSAELREKAEAFGTETGKKWLEAKE